ncbi:LytTR family transcriptional regulator DNA-binding domain-containing protein [Neobacillus pocheonensis]|uniref:LytTR family transcriptional regulator DNA-binding domain-containing protein n=1 Tax=Neobacillus pocheonensis TaxID=363869 RepID=UPI003D2B0D03
MQIPVYCTTTNKTTTIDIEDILFINLHGNKIMIQTADSIYRPLTSLKDYAELLNEHGFEKLENSTLINLKKL